LNVYSQETDLNHFKWKNRLVLVISKDGKEPEYQKQIEEFTKKPEGYNERKLVVLDIQKNKFRKIEFIDNKTMLVNKWQENNDLYREYASRKEYFKVLLIGLDGGIKRTKKRKILSKSSLFAIIDGMPMRRAELKR